MNRLLVELNRDYVKKQVNKIIDDLFDDLKKMSLKVASLEKEKKRITENKVILARAYARKIGVILTQKEYIKKFVKDPLDEIFVESHDVLHAVRETGGKDAR